MLSVCSRHRVPGRQIWGAISDRIGGLATVLIGSAWQAASMAAFLSTQNEAGLFTVAAAFGLGFSGIIPAYILAVRELFPAFGSLLENPRHCCCSAAEAWPPVAGSPGCSTTISGIMHPHSPLASAPTFSICLWSVCWSGGEATAQSMPEMD